MLIRRFKQDVLRDMGDLKLKLIDMRVSESEKDNSVLVKCQHIETGRRMHLRVDNPSPSDKAFDYTNSFVVGAAVSGSRRVYSTYEFICQSIDIVSASGAKVKIERSA